MLYLAYGSNLNIKEMKSRCPNAKLVGVGTVNGYELEFRYYLSVKPSSHAKTLVGVWEVDDNDLDTLDYYEGYPHLYHRKPVDCILDDKIVQGIIYIMNENKCTYGHNRKPDHDYLVRCIEGYCDCNIDCTQLIEAYKKTQ